MNKWYDQLTKPKWTPEPGTIGLIWTLLYPIILIAYGFVFYKLFRREVSWLVALPFMFNLAFTPIQFGLKNLPLACLDIALVLITIMWAMAAIWPQYKWVALAQIPYLLWVSTATVLQFQITLANR
jgi:benzodiazapine receptor